MNELIPKPIATIGLPVYNGEKFIEKRLRTILNQTFLNYEIIISDNCSTDNTEKICKSFSDKRIKYIKQEKNIGPRKNFKFVLEQASGKYFVWAAVDDLWSEQFLEKNINVLEQNKNYVGSISKVKKYGGEVNLFLPDSNDNFFKKKYKKIRRFFRPFDVISYKGNYKEKAIQFLNIVRQL